MCCLFFVFFCWVGKLLCCCFFWIMMKSNKKPVKEKRAVGIQKKLMAQGGWNFKLQRKLAIVEVQDHFVQSFSKEMVGRKLFVTYSPNCQQFPVQGRSFFLVLSKVIHRCFHVSITWFKMCLNKNHKIFLPCLSPDFVRYVNSRA